ncbi:MAG: ABC transporter permease [Flavobacteriia bacterium]|nr:ABC transporter permease [Flavobacteriia bacterium]
MMKLLKIEWNKIFYYKATRTFTIIYFVLLIAAGFILANIKPTIGGVKVNIVKMGMFEFPVVWQNLTYLISILKIFIGVIIITNVTAEYTNSTLKQNLIDGLSKKEFLASKLLTNLIFAFLSTLFVFGIALGLGLAFSKNQENIFQGFQFVAVYFLKLNLFFSICLFLSILLKRTAFAFLGLIVLWMGEGLISAGEVIIKAMMGDGFKNINPYDFYLTNYLPLNTSSKLIDFPDINTEGFLIGGSIFKYSTVNPSFVVAAIVYFVIFSCLSYWILKKRDL